MASSISAWSSSLRRANQWHTFYGAADYNKSAAGLAAGTDGSILLAGSEKVSMQ